MIDISKLIGGIRLLRKKLNLILTSLYRNKKYFYSIIAGLFLISTLIFIHIINLPPFLNQEIKENTISQETIFDVKADISPNILYPNGGLVDLGEGVPTSLINDIIV